MRDIKKYRLNSDAGTASFKIAYAEELNPSQYAVVTSGEGPSLVLAGAGSGKTRTLIYRVAYLLEKGVRPEEILLVTFTNKAAQEMRKRIELLLKSETRGLWCGTFHHVGNRILRMYGQAAGLPPDFGILDDEDSRDLVKNCLRALELKSSGAGFPKPGVVQSILSYAVNAKKSLEDAIFSHSPYLSQWTREFQKIQALYEEKKRKTNNLDYDDLLVRWIELLQKSPAVRERLTRQFRHLMVDEYQDTNRLQHELIRILSTHHRNVLVVGDDAQSIYSFRAAEIKNILEFPDDFPGTQTFKLETNYRSSDGILELANASIRNNVHQFPKTLKGVKGAGVAPAYVRVRDGRQEARFVAQRVLEFRDGGVRFPEIAVLFRARFQAAELELELAKRGVPYVIRGGVRFFEQAHIKDVVAFLRILVNPLDEISWTRALLLQNGVGAGYAEKIFGWFAAAGASLEKSVEPAFGESLPPRAKEGLANFKRILKTLLRPEVRNHPGALIEEIVDKWYRKFALLNFENAQDRIEDLRELVNFAHTYQEVKDFLADVTLREGFKGESVVEGGPTEATEMLLLSTIHQAKGLEWKAVFVIGLSEGQFPHARSMEDPEELEEERRLFYVAVTRAKEELILVHPMTRYDYSEGMVIQRPSVFIEELPSGTYEEVEIEEAQTEAKTIYLD